MKVTSKVNKTNLHLLNSLMKKNLIKSVEALKIDVIDSKVMPFDTGAMQNRNMYVDTKSINKGFVLLKVDGSYPRRLYFHPEYNFRKDKNENAQGQWFVPWISGNKKLFLSIAFARFMRKDLEKYGSNRN